TRRFVLELFGDVLPNARPGVATRAVFVGVGDVDLDAAPGQVRRQRPPSRRSAARMTADRRLARIHFHRFGDQSGLVGELLQRELELPRIDTVGFFSKEALTEDVELMPQRGDLALRGGQLLLKRGNEGACGGEIINGGVERARLIHSALYTISLRAALTARHLTSRWTRPDRTI